MADVPEVLTRSDPPPRIIQEFVPGRQVTLAHLIANPDDQLYPKVGLEASQGSIGVITITPGEAAIIAADVATKASGITLGFVDRFSGAVVIQGTYGDVESALRDVVATMQATLHFTPAPITKT
ncbi:MAG: BMC domain-containing protein [Propionibacteriaceae bacterium]|jgi:ethanolamine utilization protein EutS|nr:BMC domain-containing protein [Propionibacteriaceae bacterium]